MIKGNKLVVYAVIALTAMVAYWKIRAQFGSTHLKSFKNVSGLLVA